jgi:hypothetical protein
VAKKLNIPQAGAWLVKRWQSLVVAVIRALVISSPLHLSTTPPPIIPKHFEPSPARARPAHEPYWTGVGRDLEARENIFLPEPGPKCCF